MRTCSYNVDPLTPIICIAKLGFTGGIHIFLIFALKQAVGTRLNRLTNGRVTIRAKNRVVGHPVQQNVLYIKMFGIICNI